jgi:hypothetical protein
MDELNPRHLTRQQLARFLPSHELVKAFEALFSLAGATPDAINTLTQLVEEASATAESASARQHAIAAQLSRVADALDIMSMAPAVEPMPAPEVYTCPDCAPLREELIALRQRIEALESSPP